METDYCKSSARLQAVGQSTKCDLKPFQFIIDSDSQRLKRSSCRIDPFVTPSRHRFADNASQIRCRFDRLLSPDLDNAAGDPSAEALLSIFVNQVCKVLGAEASDKPYGWFAARCIKSQV